jgi:tetratricopeptide (TPR) repeat protein
MWLSRADEANLAIVAGELERASSLATAALEIGRQSERDALACFAAQQTSIAFEAGRLPELVPLLEQAVAANPGVPGFRATLALALLEGSRREEAGELLLQAAAVGFEDIPHDVTWLTVICIYGYVSVQLESRSSAKAVYELLKPWQRQLVFPAFGVWGPVELFLGTLAGLLGERRAAEAHLAAAVEIARRTHAPLWEARAAVALSRLTESPM